MLDNFKDVQEYKQSRKENDMCGMTLFQRCRIFNVYNTAYDKFWYSVTKCIIYQMYDDFVGIVLVCQQHIFPLSTIDVMGVEMLPAMFGVSQLLQGFVEIMIGTLTGLPTKSSYIWQYNIIYGFTYTCWILGGCPLVGFCLWLLMPCAERFDRKLYQDQKVKNKCEQEAQNC
ncbi:hypothetical protein Avbf_10743 [Armadillidium vulgare]|nr:hypothetical protein Avbf_10743 [Armadillidium vulgare]